MYDPSLVGEIRDIVAAYPNSYARVLSSSARSGLMREIDAAVPLLSGPAYCVKTRIWWILNGVTEFPACPVCGKPMTGCNVSRLSKGYPGYCCRGCMYGSKSYSDAIRDSFRARYGVDNAFQLESVREGLSARSDEIKAKRLATRNGGRNTESAYGSRKASAGTFYGKYGAAAFSAFAGYDFPYVSETDTAAVYELNRLKNEQTKDQTPSRLIRSFHRSMYSCRRKNMMSPAGYWSEFKNAKYFENGEWRDFFVNRYTYAESKSADSFRRTGIMSPKMILDGFTITHRADCVSYLKPMLAKRLVREYLAAAAEVFCPFNGFSGIMLGSAVGCGKKFIGRDINRTSVAESAAMIEYIRSLGFAADADVSVADVFGSSGRYDALFACPPYGDTEQWNFDASGVNTDRNIGCDGWIDVCLERFDCRRYLFVTDDATTVKYGGNIVERLENRSHFGSNFEYVVLIER